MTGTRAMSGSVAIRFRKRVIAARRVEHRLVHVDVDDLRAVLDLLARDATRLLVLLVQDQAREGLRAGDVGALADVDEQRVVGDVERLEAGQPQRLRQRRHRARRHAVDRARDRADVIRRRAAAAAGDVDEARVGELPQQRRRDLGRLVEAGVAHRVGQAGVRIHADEDVGHRRQLLDVRPHQRRAERAVEADGQRPRVAHRVPERLDRLAGEDAARRVGDGAGDHDRQPRRRCARSNSASIAKIAALAFSVSKMVSTSSRSAPPSSRPRACSP